MKTKSSQRSTENAAVGALGDGHRVAALAAAAKPGGPLVAAIKACPTAMSAAANITTRPTSKRSSRRPPTSRVPMIDAP
jgi:hypothetical protein